MQLSNIILMVAITFLFTVFFIPVIGKIANHIGALDIQNKRKVNNNDEQ